MKTLNLKPGKDVPFLYRHPWIFSGAINNATTNITDGEVIKVLSSKNEFISYGIYNSKSQIRVRNYSFDISQEITPDFFRQQIKTAINLRKNILGIAGKNSASRLIFSEADQLSGLTLDQYDNYLVMQITSFSMYHIRELLIDILTTELKPTAIYLKYDKSMLKEEGFNAEDEVVYGTLPEIPFLIEENGLKYEISLYKGQKTGFYTDQQNNHLAVRKYAQNRKALDICSYLGGFALNLAVGGATEITAVDISDYAIKAAERNAELNNLKNIIFVKSDAFSYLAEAQEKYDIIVLDPPKFTHKQDSVKQALTGYRKLNEAAMRLLNKNGILVTCSCSGRVTKEEFIMALSQASVKACKTIQILEQRTASSDHPLSPYCPETQYLKCIILRVN